MFIEIPMNHFHYVPYFYWQTIQDKKPSDVVSHTWKCTKSGEKSTELMRLLFCPEKIFLSNKLKLKKDREKTKN